MEIAIEASHEAVELKELTSKKDSTEMENRLLLKMKELELQIKEVDARIRELEAKIEIKFKAIESSLELKILQSKNQIIIWIVSLLFANGLITHFLK